MTREERRREKRQTSRLEIEVYLSCGGNSPPATPLFKGRLMSFSRYGAGIALHEIMAGSIHLVYGPMESNQLIFNLVLPLEPDPPLLLPSEPIWFDKIFEEDTPPFRLGIQFLEPLPSRLVRLISKLPF